ncbi:MAG: preprotein translocase subunit SecG [Microgenomates group bacterium]
MVKNIFLILQIFLGICLVFLIILQGKGTSLSRPLLGNIGIYSTRRGVEKLIFYLTIVFAFLFFLSSFTQLLL